MDSSGNTVVYSQLCLKVSCNCPNRLVAGTVDSLLGKLNAIFNNIGRLRLTLKSTLNLIARNRQARLLSLPRQCRCFALSFLRSLMFFRHCIRCSSYLSLVNDYILVRDTVFFVVDFFTRNLSSDLGRLLASQVFISLKDRKGFLLHLTLT